MAIKYNIYYMIKNKKRREIKIATMVADNLANLYSQLADGKIEQVIEIKEEV